jgi:Zn-dependent peptidase ImmA (M78 family)
VDPDARRIYRAPSLEPGTPKFRSVIMHEYMHDLLGHEKDTDRPDQLQIFEAEASYAAVHYLVPAATFDLVLSQVVNRQGEMVPKLSAYYQVPEGDIRWYLKEREHFWVSAGSSTKALRKAN